MTSQELRLALMLMGFVTEDKGINDTELYSLDKVTKSSLGFTVKFFKYPKNKTVSVLLVRNPEKLRGYGYRYRPRTLYFNENKLHLVIEHLTKETITIF